MDKEQMLKASMVNVQQNITTQINIGVVKGNYFQHVENVNIGAPAKEEEPRKKEYSVEILFGRAENNRREAKRFCQFLKDQGMDGTMLNSAKGNAVNKAFVALYLYRMEKEELPEQPNGDACYRFLKEDCGLEFSVNQKTYANFIRKAIETWDEHELRDMTDLIRKAYTD